MHGRGAMASLAVVPSTACAPARAILLQHCGLRPLSIIFTRRFGQAHGRGRYDAALSRSGALQSASRMRARAAPATALGPQHLAGPLRFGARGGEFMRNAAGVARGTASAAAEGGGEGDSAARDRDAPPVPVYHASGQSHIMVRSRSLRVPRWRRRRPANRRAPRSRGCCRRRRRSSCCSCSRTSAARCSAPRTSAGSTPRCGRARAHTHALMLTPARRRRRPSRASASRWRAAGAGRPRRGTRPTRAGPRSARCRAPRSCRCVCGDRARRWAPRLTPRASLLCPLRRAAQGVMDSRTRNGYESDDLTAILAALKAMGQQDAPLYAVLDAKIKEVSAARRLRGVARRCGRTSAARAHGCGAPWVRARRVCAPGARRRRRPGARRRGRRLPGRQRGLLGGRCGRGHLSTCRPRTPAGWCGRKAVQTNKRGKTYNTPRPA